MRLDHATLLALDVESTTKMLSDALGVPYYEAPALFPGTLRRVLAFQSNFVEVVGVVERRDLGQSPLGRGVLRFLAGGEGVFRVVLSVRDLDQYLAWSKARQVTFWPPIQETVAWGPHVLATRMTQCDFELPWILEYSPAWDWYEPNTVRWTGIEVSSADPDRTALWYRMAFGLSLEKTSQDIIAASLPTDEHFLLVQSVSDGTTYTALTGTVDGTMTWAIRVRSGSIAVETYPTA